jgi:hypothetical protein
MVRVGRLFAETKELLAKLEHAPESTRTLTGSTRMEGRDEDWDEICESCWVEAATLIVPGYKHNELLLDEADWWDSQAELLSLASRGYKSSSMPSAIKSQSSADNGCRRLYSEDDYEAQEALHHLKLIECKSLLPQETVSVAAQSFAHTLSFWMSPNHTLTNKTAKAIKSQQRCIQIQSLSHILQHMQHQATSSLAATAAKIHFALSHHLHHHL